MFPPASGTSERSIDHIQQGIAADADRFPNVVAVSLLEYANEKHPFARLHRLTSAAEVLTRFCVSLVIGELRQRDSADGEAFWEHLAQNLKTPTFGQWTGILREALPYLGESFAVPPLTRFVKCELLPYLGSGNSGPEGHLVNLRNELAHRGRLVAHEQKTYDDFHHAKFGKLIRAAAFLADLAVVGSQQAGDFVLLRGHPRVDTALPPSDIPWPGDTPNAEPGDAFLVTASMVIDLSPLLRFGDVFRYRGKAWQGRGASKPGPSDELFERNDAASPSVLLYFRQPRSASFLEYTAFSDRASNSQNAERAWEQFNERFRQRVPRTGRTGARGRDEFDFTDWVEEHAPRQLVGRHDEIETIVEWIEAKRHDGGVGWLEGQPGSGKSALMAAISIDERLAPGQFRRVDHFFRATDPRCHRMKFLENAVRALAPSVGRTPTLSPDPDDRAHEFKQVLSAAATRRNELPILFLLDGLDELTQHDRGFPSLILENRMPGVVWVCAGRGEGELGRTFRNEANVEKLFLSGGLPGLEPRYARKILDDGCGPEIYALLKRDSEDPLSGGNRNRFLDVLEERSKGLPLYLQLVVEDIRAEKQSFGEGGEERLPRGLDRYYDVLLDRLGISDESSLLSRVLCHLAVARAPLTLSALQWIMADDPLLAQRGGRELVESTLDFGHTLLRSVSVSGSDPRGGPRADTAYTLYHESFRDHMLARESPVRIGVAAAHAAFARRIQDWAAVSDDLFSLHYALRHGPAHLREAHDRYSEVDPAPSSGPRSPLALAAGWTPESLAATLCNPAFLQAKVTAGMGYEAVSDFRLGEPDWGGHAELVRAFARAFNQEFHAFVGSPATTAQQVIHNLIGRFGRTGPVGGWVARMVDEAEPPPRRFCRLNRVPAGRPSPGLARVLAGHGHPITAVAVSPDGEWIASADTAGTVRVWRREDGTAEATLALAEEPLAALAWDGDARIVGAGLDGRVAVWDWRANAEVRSWAASAAAVRGLGRLPSGEFVTGGDDRIVRVWGRNDHPPAELRGHLDRIFCVAADPAGGGFLTGGDDGVLRSWGGPKGPAGPVLRGQGRGMRAVAVAPSWECVSGSDDGLLTQWDLRRGLPLQSVRAHRGRVNGLAFLPGATPAVVSAGIDGLIKVFDLPPGSPRAVLAGHSHSVNAIAAVPERQEVVSGGEDGTVRLWDLSAGSSAASPVGHDGPVTCLATAPDGQRVVSGGEDGTVRIWDRFGDLRFVLRGHTGAVTALQFVGAACVVSSAEDGTVKAWDVRTGQLNRSSGDSAASLLAARLQEQRTAPAGEVPLPLESGAIAALAVAAGDLVAIAGADGTLRLWNPLTGRPEATAPRVEVVLESIAADGVSRRVYAAGRADDIISWEPGVSDPTRLRGHGSPITCLTVSRSGRLASAARDGSVCCWEAGIRRWRAEVQGGWARCLRWDEATGRLLAGTDTGSLWAWEGGTGTPAGTPVERHLAAVTGLEPAGDLVFSSGADGRLFANASDLPAVVANVHAGDPITCLALLAPGLPVVGTEAGSVVVFGLTREPSPADRTSHPSDS